MHREISRADKNEEETGVDVEHSGVLMRERPSHAAAETNSCGFAGRGVPFHGHRQQSEQPKAERRGAKPLSAIPFEEGYGEGSQQAEDCADAEASVAGGGERALVESDEFPAGYWFVEHAHGEAGQQKEGEQQDQLHGEEHRASSKASPADSSREWAGEPPVAGHPNGFGRALRIERHVNDHAGARRVVTSPHALQREAILHAFCAEQPGTTVGILQDSPPFLHAGLSLSPRLANLVESESTLSREVGDGRQTWAATVRRRALF